MKLEHMLKDGAPYLIKVSDYTEHIVTKCVNKISLCDVYFAVAGALGQEFKYDLYRVDEVISLEEDWTIDAKDKPLVMCKIELRDYKYPIYGWHTPANHSFYTKRGDGTCYVVDSSIGHWVPLIIDRVIFKK